MYILCVHRSKIAVKNHHSYSFNKEKATESTLSYFHSFKLKFMDCQFLNTSNARIK